MVTTNHSTLRMSGALNIEHLTALKLHVGVNAHGWATVEGEAGENALEQLSGALAGREQHILTLDESGAEKCLFAGVIRDAELVRVGGYNRFHVELLSGTCLMDREVRSRSFQDVSRTYSQVAQQVCSEYSSGAAICTVGEDKALGQPVIQYRETDWEFLMRMASHCGGVLVPETHRGLPRLWFGFPDRSFTCEFPEDAYTSGISQRYYELGGSAAGYSKADFFYYDVESHQLCDLGWYTVFKGQPFIIAEKSAQLERGELIFTYRLGRLGLGWGKMLYNEKISGMTLLGEVLETSRETLKLKLDIDAGWNPSGPYPYTWRPETGNFMYCMPQVGTRVSLYCPNYDEKTAIVVNCVRTNGGDCDRMSDPTKRSFVTEHGKEMNLYPNEMSLLGGSNGLIRLFDEEGITIGSQKPVVIVSNEEIKFEASQVATQVPEGELVMAKGDPTTGDIDSSHLMSNSYDTLAQDNTIVEGSNCVEYAPCDDALEESSFDWVGWGLNIAVGAVVAVGFICAAIFLPGIGALASAALMGAAMGAIAVTATIAIEDFNDGEVRSISTAINQILYGAVIGGIIGVVGAYVMPYGVATLGTGIRFGIVSGMGMRLATSNAMEHMSFQERFFYSFLNPGATIADILTAGFFTGIMNFTRLGTFAPSQSLVNQYNSQQLLTQLSRAGTAQVAAKEAERIAKLNRIYENFSHEEIDDLINYVNNEAEMLKAMGLSKNELGPALAGVYDRTTQRFFIAINDVDGVVPGELCPLIRDRIYFMPDEVFESYARTLGAGSHAEVYAANMALLANPEATLDDLLVYVIHTGKIKPLGTMFPTCPHCSFILENFNILSNLLP